MDLQQHAARCGLLVLGMAVAVGGLVPPATAVAAPDQQLALTQYVNPLIGTAVPASSGYQGNVAPGAQVPFGMVNFGPDMPRTDYNGSGGYKIGATAATGSINFFSLTHLNGPGCPGGGVVGMMPASTPRSVSTAAGVPQAVTFQTSTESVSPGYYSTSVAAGSSPAVKAELTATARTGMARFTYPDKDSGYYSLDTRLNATSNMSSTRGKISADNVELTVSPDGTVLTGKTVAPAFCTPWGTKFTSNVYFYATFDKALRAQGAGSTVNTVTNGSALLQYDLSDSDPTLTVRVGISSVSLANAQLNLETENRRATFDQVRAAADAEWNDRLNAVQIDRAADPGRLTAEQRDDLTTFYTALYRVFVSPTTYSDVNGEYRSMKANSAPSVVDTVGAVETRNIEDVDDETFTRLDGSRRTPKVHYSGLSMWDTYRSAAQALTLFAPEVSNDVMQSLVADGKQCGAFPHWVDASDDSVPMAGDNALAVLAASHAFGATDFDLKAAARLVKQSVFDPTSNCNGNSSSSQLRQYLDDGYRAVGVDGQASSSNIEQNAADHAAGMFLSSLPAQVLADPSVNITDAEIAKLHDRSTWWKNIFDYDTGVIAQRAAPTTAGTSGALSTGVFHESTEPNYFWSFGYAWPDLIEAIGGKAAAVTRLNKLFSLDDALTARPTAQQLNGGQSATTLYIGNEPALPAPWAYNWAGKPAATQYIVQRIMDTAFSTARDGLPGNDDYGATSSWYVFAALGMFPVAQAHGGFALSTPQFPAMTVRFGDRTLRIEANADPASAPFIQSMSVNGVAQERSWITLGDLLREKRGTLSYNLGTAATSWAAGDPTGPATSTTSLAVSADRQVFGTASPASATAAVTFSDGASQPGRIDLLSGGRLIGSAPLGKGGTATLAIPASTPLGVHSIVASFVPTDSARVKESVSAAVQFVVAATAVTDASVLRSAYEAAVGMADAAESYTPTSWSVLQASLAKASATLDDASATQEKIDAAVTELARALAGLVVASPVPDSAVLRSIYDSAAALSNPGGSYTAESWSRLQAKMAAAKAVLDDGSAPQSRIDAVAKELAAALSGLTLTPRDTPPPVAKVKLNQSRLSLVKGKSLTVEDAVYYADARLTPSYVGQATWKSSNAKVATVSADGVVTARRAGSATITVTTLEANVAGKKLSASMKVTVVNSAPRAKVTRVSASVPTAMSVGQTVYITGTYSSSRATGVKVSYTTSKPNIVLIDKAGRMRAVSKGTEYVKVKAGGKTRSFRITVR